MANRNVRQISVFLDGKQVEGSIKNIAGAFREATNRLAKMVVGSEEYIAQLEEVRKYNDALTEHRNRIRGISDDTDAAAGSMNALQQEVQGATSTLNNLVIGSAEYDEQLRKVQALEAQITEARKNQQAQNIATAGSINAMEQEYKQTTEELNMLVVGSEEYNEKLKELQESEAQLTEARKKQRVQNTATAGSIRALEEELQRERNILRELVIGTKEYQEQAKKVQELDDNLTKHQQSLKGVGQGWSLAKIGIDRFVGVAAGAFAVDSLIGYGKQLYGVGVQMDALDKKARTVFGNSLPQVTAEAEKNAAAMGLTTSQYINAAAAIQDILIPMGFQRKEAADISTQLTNLSGALSEWTGGQVSATQVSEILSSALTGEREQLKQLGIVLQEEDIKARLAEKGLEKLTGTMRQQAEAAATLELILEKSTDAQAGFADGADSAIRRQAELTAKIREITENLATLLLPVFEELAEVVGATVEVIDGVVSSLQEMAGVQHKASDATRESQIEFNALIGVLKNVNATETTRNQAISELQSKYGSYIGNIDLHKATESQLNEVLKKGNDLFVKRIFLQSQEEELAEFASNRLELEKEIFENEKERAKIAQGGGFFDNANKLGDKANEAKRLAQELDVLNAKEAEFVKNQEEFAKKLNILPGETVTSTTTGNPDKPKGDGTPSADALKEAERLAKDLEDLIERTTEARLDLISKSQDDELAVTIRGIEKRYDAEIAKALELEKKGVTEATAQRIALEHLKNEEIGMAVEEDIKKAIAENEEIAEKGREESLKNDLDYWAKVAEERAKVLEEQAEAEAAIKEFTNEALLSERELELMGVSEQYQKLLADAEKYGKDTAALTEAYRKRVQEINDKYDKEQKEKDVLTLKERMEALEAAFAGFGDLAMATYDLLGKEGAKGAEFQKIATLAKIAFDTAAAISSLMAASEGNPLNLLTGGAAGIAQFAAGLARIITTAAQAKKILSGAPQVKQKAEGGFLTSEGDTATTTQNTYNSTSTATGHHLTVTGEDDRRNYTAAVIPPPNTGLLPHHPVLFQSQATGAPVLASERGAEYFVSSESLRNPYVANLTRMIDNIAAGGRGVPQFAEGGVNAAGTTTTVPVPVATASPAVDMATLEQLTASINTLNALLASGIVAVIPDRTLTAIPERLGKINSASGGYFG